jgi:hypothetical protein
MEEKTTGSQPQAPGCFFCAIAVPFLEQLWPQNTRDHFRNSRVEFLKGIRSILDARIEHLSRGHQKGTHVSVE